MANIINPHDKFFRGNMHNIQMAQNFLERYMREQDKAALDLSTLRIRESSHINEGLVESISDLVYSCQYKDKNLGESRVVVLVEHQSTPQRLMPFRVYHYLFNLLADELSAAPNQNKLPAATALVFYHGELTLYPYSMCLQDCFDDPANIMGNFWKNPVHLIDINTYDDDELINQHIEGLMSIALKHGRDKYINDILLRIAHALLAVDLSDEYRLQFSGRIASYLLSQGEVKDKQAFNKQVTKLPKLVRGTIMTFAEEMKLEGRVEGEIKGLVKGRVEGVIEGQIKVAINCLKQGLPPKLVSQLADLSLERISELKQEHNL